MRVSDVMSRGVISVGADTPLRKAAIMMLQYGLTGLPVLERGKLVGMITEGDLLRRVETNTERERTRWSQSSANCGQLAGEYTREHGRSVGEVMTRQVATVDENAPLAEAASLMQTHRVKRLPVVNCAGLVGIISRMDLLHAYVAAPAKDAAAPMSDAAIQEQLMAELACRPWVPHRSFRAEVSNGMVDLFGVIWDERQRTALRVAAENVPGVKEVHDHLKLFDPSTLL